MTNINEVNKHEKDNFIKFDEEPHVYYVNGKPYKTSVTSFVHSFFDCFDGKKVIEKFYDYWQSNESSKYFGMMPQEILDEWEEKGRKASELGTIMHKDIELHYLGENIKNETKEFSYFLEFYNDNKELKPYRTEWNVYDEILELAGSIDMTFEENGKLKLFDWKRSKEIKDSSRENGYYPISHLSNANYWHYSLQLNIYKAILEKNYGLEVESMALVVLHPNNDSYQLIKVPDLSDEVEMMFKERVKELSKIYPN